MKIISRNTFEIFSNTKHVLLLLRCTMFSSKPSLVTIPVSSKFRHGNYFTRGTRHARRKCHFEKYLVTKYEKWFPRCVRLSIIDYRFRTFVRKIQPLVIRNLRPGSNFEERAFAVVRADSIYGASPFSGGGPRWYRGEA